MSRRRALALLGASAFFPAVGCNRTESSAPPRTCGGNSEPLHYLSLQDVGRRIAAREMSPITLTQHMLDRIASVDIGLKSYATVMRDQALADARRAEAEIQSGKYRGPLHGVPIAVKDLCYTKGTRTMGGTSVLKSFVPEFDGTVVSKLREAGAVLLGKLNLTEAAMAGYNPAFDVAAESTDMRHSVIGPVLLCVMGAACSRGPASMDESQRRQITQSVEQALRSFEAAERTLDADRLVRHFAAVPDFHIYNDGQRLSYEVMVAGVRSTFPTLRSIDGGFQDLQIIVLAPDAALSTATFQETVTDATGTSTRQHGAASWLWRQIDGEWRIAYGHVDHYPDTSSR